MYFFKIMYYTKSRQKYNAIVIYDINETNREFS